MGGIPVEAIDRPRHAEGRAEEEREPVLFLQDPMGLENSPHSG